jgi:hypothetical protein
VTCNILPLKANSHIRCRSPAALIHTCHAAPLPFSDSAVSFVKVHVLAGNIRTASENGMLLVTTFVELRVVAGRNRTRAGRPNAVSGRRMLIHICLAMPCLEKSLSERHDRGMARARHGLCESNTAALCKSHGENTIQTLSRTAWQGNGMVCVNWPLQCRAV